MVVKIRIKAGQFEIEFEGDKKFLEKDFLGLVTQVAGVFKGQPEILTAEPSASISAPTFGDHFSTNTIATKLSVDRGPELVIAAAAHLALVQKRGTFSRKEIADEMKKAPQFYKRSYGSNLAKIIDRLVKSDRLHLVGERTYSLAAKEKSRLEDKLTE